MSAQEIATNSLVGLFRELPDSGKVELRDQRSFSESDNVTAGMATSDQLVAQELRTRRSSPSVLQSAATSESQNYLMKAFARTHCNDKMVFDETSDAERVIAVRSRPEGHETERASIVSSNVEAEIYSLYRRSPLGFSGSLPPTPISESPQLLPAVGRSDRESCFCKRPPTIKTERYPSSPAIISPYTPTPRYLHQRPLLMRPLSTSLDPSVSPASLSRSLSRTRASPPQGH